MTEKSWNIEQTKLMYDHTKHVTTLCTGSILILIAFLEKLTNQPAWKFMIKAALALFISSIIAATLAQIGVIDLAEPKHTNAGPEAGLWQADKFTAIALIIAWVTFSLAMISLVVFGFRNI
jgi:hypothetical protein